MREFAGRSGAGGAGLRPPGKKTAHVTVLRHLPNHWPATSYKKKTDIRSREKRKKERKKDARATHTKQKNARDERSAIHALVVVLAVVINQRSIKSVKHHLPTTAAPPWRGRGRTGTRRARPCCVFERGGGELGGCGARCVCVFTAKGVDGRWQPPALPNATAHTHNCPHSTPASTTLSTNKRYTFCPIHPASTYCCSSGQGRYLVSPSPVCSTFMMLRHVSRPFGGGVFFCELIGGGGEACVSGVESARARYQPPQSTRSNSRTHKQQQLTALPIKSARRSGPIGWLVPSRRPLSMSSAVPTPFFWCFGVLVFWCLLWLMWCVLSRCAQHNAAYTRARTHTHTQPPAKTANTTTTTTKTPHTRYLEQAEEGLVDHRDEHAVDQEARAVLARAHLLAHELGQALARLERLCF